MTESEIKSLLEKQVSRRGFVTLASASIVALAATQALPKCAFAVPQSNKIAIIHTNDVHCQLTADADKGYVGYAGVATLFKQAQADYGAANAVLVDAGDNLQGKVEGAVTSGSACVEIMNALGYSYAALGNHDFDFGIQTLMDRRAQANYQLLSCNVFKSGEATPLIAPYAIATYAGKKVAFVGITTPETLIKSNPETFRDDDGTLLYDFKQDETGEALYTCVQNAVDAARNEGAQYVVALAHLGMPGVAERWTSAGVTQHTSGIDVIIDGHSHQKYVMKVKNKASQDVIIVQAGTQLAAVGRVIINTETNEITAELLGVPVDEDASAKAVVNQIEESVSSQTSKVVAHTCNDLVAVLDDGEERVARLRETNLGDLSADAFRVRTGADFGFSNGGGLRKNIDAGDITYGDVLSVMPFYNASAVVRVSGQDVLDALELGARLWPAPSGGFMQVSGLSYEIRTDIESTVELDSSLNFVRVTGARRVQNVRTATGAIDPAGSYTVAGTAYLLLNGGDGYVMLGHGEAVLSEGPIDSQLFADFLSENLQGEIGEEYANRKGQGRIVFKDGPDDTPGDDDNDDDASGDAEATGDEAETTGDDSEALPATGDCLLPVTVIAAGAAAVAAATATVAALAEAND